MKVLLLNGSPKANGNTAVALHEMVDIFNKEGIETEVIHVGNKDIRGCVACGQCSELGHCVFNDLVNEVAPKFAEADGLVVGSPVYYASANATLVALLTPPLWLPAAAAFPPRSTNSTNSLRSPACPSRPVSIGTAFTALHQARRKRIWRVCKPCAPWREI